MDGWWGVAFMMRRDAALGGCHEKKGGRGVGECE
jgi:hypothetical protein